MSKDISRSDYIVIKEDWNNIIRLMRAGNIKDLRKMIVEKMTRKERN